MVAVEIVNNRASPARAGMDRQLSDIGTQHGSFPRTGGDGPDGQTLLEDLSKLPPHGRGWTSLSRTTGQCVSASPARAGMDRVRRIRASRTSCFPRTGGDGPVATDYMQSRQQLPPHGRGWTFEADDWTRLVAASPARAGMDPDLTGTYWVEGSFPRTGGDGPSIVRRPFTWLMLPPHGRGWT